MMGGLAGGMAPTLMYNAVIYINGQEYPCRLHADFVGHERILGRDILNQLRVLFHGPALELVLK